ncbi:MAG: hypothetical protein RBT25_04790 [Lentisphaeria bacterium]|nr:hypothetical protein [Lentisphaeria bacterium]
MRPGHHHQIKVSTPVARKRYACSRCASVILPGQLYESEHDLSSGLTVRLCQRCVAASGVSHWHGQVKIDLDD